MKNEIMVQTPAKINLTLQVFHKRADGFHEIETVMQAVSLWDRIEVRVRGAGENQIFISCVPKKFHVPEDENNLCYKAVEKFLKEAKLKGCQVEINIRKKIPPGSGLGGGSGNAAGSLVALNTLFNDKLSNKKLLHIAEKIGSDVPYFFHGGLALCRGRGEKIIPFDVHVPFTAILVFPDFFLSTKEVYENLPLARRPHKSINMQAVNTYSKPLIDSIREKSIIDTGAMLRNDLEKSKVQPMKDIAFIKKVLLQQGASHTSMSGSGSCVYGIFKTREESQSARMYFSDRLKNYRVRLCHSIPFGIRKVS